MALNIKDDRADRLVRELAAETGESITTAVTVAVRERLERLRGAALAKTAGRPLLFKGSDFSGTDVAPASE